MNISRTAVSYYIFLIFYLYNVELYRQLMLNTVVVFVRMVTKVEVEA